MTKYKIFYILLNINNDNNNNIIKVPSGVCGHKLPQNLFISSATVMKLPRRPSKTYHPTK